MPKRIPAVAGAGLAALMTVVAPVAEAAGPGPDHPTQGENAPERYLVGELIVTCPVIGDSDPKVPGSTMAFVEIANRGPSQDRLLGASVMGAEKTVVADQGSDSTAIALRPGDDVRMAAAGPHLLIQGLRQPLKAGDTIGGQLVFERAGPLTVAFVVEPSTGAPKP